ncbi:metallophosphoesterase [Sorangium sp. So ce375]|uniref:metallophosphoesterase n=1 Tax=Sorangium sp. So ce375 TaxID=3133306 RepID=UPI003F5B67A5
MTYRVRILHISDIHFRGRREREPWRVSRVLGESWDRNLDELCRDGATIDIVALTGDVAFSGEAHQYAAASSFIDALLGRIGVPRTRLFVVPGNHDIDRSLSVPAWECLREQVEPHEELAFSRWMAGVGRLRGIAPEYRDQILLRQGAYRTWVGAELGRPELLPEATLHPSLGYRATLRLPGMPFDVHVIGLDSAWLAGNDSDAGKLRLTDDQVLRLANDADGRHLRGYRLALMHHPLGDLADGNASRRLLAARVDLLLRGHQHEPEAMVLADPDRALYELAAGCLYEHDHYPNACHLIDLTLDADGRPQRRDVRFRAWSRRSEAWYDDGSLYRASPGDGLSLQNALHGAGPAPAPAPSRPAAPAVTAAAPARGRPRGVFVGREAELRELEAALLPTSGIPAPTAVCALHGMAGVGKSYLVDRFAELHAARFPGGYLKLVLDQDEQRDEAGLLAELTERLKLGAGLRDPGDAVRSWLRESGSLLHIENVDSRPVASTAAALVRRLEGCAVVVTGRFQVWAPGDDPGCVVVLVRPFEEVIALEQLAREHRAPGTDGEQREHEQLVRALGGLPLAVHLAAGHLRRGRSVQGFLDQLRKKGLALEPAAPVPPAERARAVVRTSLELSLDLLRRELTPADVDRQMAGLAALGLAPAAGVGRGLGAALAGLSVLDVEDLLVRATELSVAERVSEAERPDGAWRLHPLVAELLLERASEEEALDRMTAWFLERLPELPFGQETEQGRRWREIRTEQAALIHWLARAPARALAQIGRAGSWYAWTKGPFRSWLDLYERAIAASGAPALRSELLWTHAYVALRAGEPDRALAAAREKRALDLSRGDDYEAALASGVIADVLQRRGELEEVLRIRREEELPVYERHSDARSHAITVGQVAEVLELRGELEEAMRIRREQELPVYERLGDARSRAVTLGEIADAHEARGELEEAMRIRREEQLPVFERLGDDRERAVTLSKIASARAALGQLDEALRIYREDVLPALEYIGDVQEMISARQGAGASLLRRGQPGDREQARALLVPALRDAERLRLPAADEIRRALRELDGDPGGVRTMKL